MDKNKFYLLGFSMKNKLIDSIPESASMQMGQVAREKKNISDMINLGIGDTHFRTPARIIEKAYTYMNEGKTHYDNAQGIQGLRETISRYLAQRFDTEYAPDEIIVTPGSKQGLFYCLFLLVEPSMNVLLFEPTWLAYVPIIKISGGTPIFCELDNNKFTEKSLSALSKKNIRVIVLNNPTNPSGKVWTREELDLLASYCKRKKIKIISDEVYNEIVYDKEFVSLGCYNSIKNDLLLIESFSKTFSMTGWRLGYICVKDSAIRERLIKLQQIVATCPTSFTQYAIADALEDELENTEKMVTMYKKNRNLIFETLKKTRLKPTLPDGTFYLWVDVGEDGEAFAQKVLEDLHIIVVPGKDYGIHTQNYIRISYAMETEKIEEACRRFRNAFKK